ncbi:MAG: S8 family serine peptidase [Verrucomicrobiae bacterium]|nr:S8 family serine peptidase [Verrucomicrobiae bacterium]
MLAKRDLLTDEHVVRFRDEADLNRLVSLAREVGLEVAGRLDALRLVRFRSKSGDQWRNLSEKLGADCEVSANYAVRMPVNPVGKPGKTAEVEAASSYVPFAGNYLNWLGVENNANWGKGILVAVIDSGVGEHPDFAGKGLTCVDLIQGSGEDAKVVNGHGTAVASLIVGAHGVAPAADLLSIRVLSNEGVSDEFTLAQGLIMAADQGARVINLSLGSYGDGAVLREAVEYARQKGAIIVAAAGNDGLNDVAYPAKYEDVVAVGAVDAAGNHVDFSNQGKVNLTAPGYGVHAAWPENRMVSMSGTSGAAPLVSGALAGLLSENPGMSANEAVELLQRYSDDSGPAGLDAQYGSGILDVGWVMSRNQPGIYQVAVSGIQILNPTTGNSEPQLAVGVQNRGTETLPVVELEVLLGPNSQRFYFQNIDPSRTVCQLVPIGIFLSPHEKTMQVSVTARVSGVAGKNIKASSRKAVVRWGG